MKKWKVALFATVILVIVLVESVCSLAYDKNEHDSQLEKVFFNAFKYNLDADDKEKMKLLECASYLAIDQFNGNGTTELELLKKAGIKNIPKTINEIDFTSNSYHREKTHKGWNTVSSGMETKWPIRKEILRSTVGYIFDFDGNENQKEAFCKLIYYVHILGDHQADKSNKDKNMPTKMGAGGRHDKADIIDELLECILVLFKSQTKTHKYRNLEKNLTTINGELSEIVNSTGGINTEEKFEKYQKCVDDLFEVLCHNIPEMLKDEEFFNKAFYGK